jgi:hypothetical protein
VDIENVSDQLRSVGVRMWLQGGRDGLFFRHTYLELKNGRYSAEQTRRCRLQ